MRIMHIITRFIRGGAQENTLLTLRGQSVVNPENVCLVTGPTRGPEGTLVPDARKLGIAIYEMPHLIRAVSPLDDFRAFGELRRIIRDWRPDIVHTHSSKAGILGRWAASMEKVPGIVHTIHGLPFHPYQNRFLNFAYIAAEKFAARRCHQLVTVARAMTDQSVAAGVAPSEKFTTVYSGMEVEKFCLPSAGRENARRQYGFAPTDIVIGKIARLFALKGHEYLLDAFAVLLKDFPQLRLFLVGDGSWRERLENRARDLGVAGRIAWAGLLHPEEVPVALQAMDIVAHCSLREGLARVIPQGLLAGKPVVAFDVDGAREILEPICPDWLVLPQDIPALCRALSAVIRNLPQAAALAREKGTPYCRENFAWQTMCARLAEIYQRQLANHQPIL